jgi:hypothetical protein
MKSCLVLSGLDQRYKVQNFTTANLKLIESNWRGIKASLEATLRLVNRFGIDREVLTSVNALLPIAYYLYHLERGSLDGSTQFEATNAKRIHHWLLGSLLNGVFGGSSDQTIGTARSIIHEALKTKEDFPYRGLVQGLASRGRVTAFDENNIEGVLEASYGKRTCFLALSLLYDSHVWGATPHHIDHIIPRSLADPKALQAAGLAAEEIAAIVVSMNRLGNLQLLLGRENLEKSNIPFVQWIQTRDDEFLNRHLIPKNSALWDITELPKFVEAREELIRQRLRRLELKPADDERSPDVVQEVVAGN